MGKLTGHTQEVCGLGIESLSVSSPHALILTFFVSSSGYSLLLSVWSKDGRTLASGGNDNCVQLWDWQVGDLTKQRQGIRPVIHMTDITIQARETPMNTITAHQSAVKAVSWCPWQNNVLATAGQTSSTLGTLVVHLAVQVVPWIER